MSSWLKEIDDLLRGSKTQPESLAEGTGGLRLQRYAATAAVLGAVYGLSMGLYGALTHDPAVYAQFFSSALKVPALFFLTLVVTFPSLYVFSALVGARLDPLSALRVIVATITVSLAVLASFAPINAFFTLSTTSYAFMKLLNVFLFAVAGAVGLGFLLKTLRHLEEAWGLAESHEGEGTAADSTPVQDVTAARKAAGRGLFKLWMCLYALVGAQMGWLLRPFIGDPKLPFGWFRERGGSVFLDVLQTIEDLLGG